MYIIHRKQTHLWRLLQLAGHRQISLGTVIMIYDPL